MRALIGVVGASLLIGCSSSPGTDPESAPSVFVFDNVSVVPMDRERVLDSQTVVVENGVIVAVGRDSIVPDEAVRIDGEGKFLLPGLSEMHGHLPSPDMPSEMTEHVLFLYIANGVTTVRGMQGNASQLELRDRIEAREVTGPRLIVGSPSMTGNRVTTPEEGDALVREYHEAGFDLLKVHEGLSPETYDAITATANALEMPFAGHVSDHVGLMRALESGQTTIDHLDNYVEALVPEDRRPEVPPGLRGAAALVELIDESLLEAVVRATRAADASVVPTMVLWEDGLFPSRDSRALIDERPELRYMPRETVDRWAEAVDSRLAEVDPESMRRFAGLRRRILAVLYQGGVRILLGTDSPQIFSVPGFSIHREMALYVEVGLTPFEVLASGTSVVGDYLDESVGTVTPGARADLVLVEDDPLEDLATLSAPVGVMVNGSWYPRARIRERLLEIASHYD